jgi:hypothetical protein
MNIVVSYLVFVTVVTLTIRGLFVWVREVTQ